MSDLYGPVAADYRELWAPVIHPYGKLLLDRLPLGAARSVLDLGTGVGTLLPVIRERAPHARVVAVDVTEGMIRLAPSSLPRTVMDAGRLGFRDASFDVVVCAFVLFNVQDPPSAAQGILQVVVPGGAVGFATWGPAGICVGIDVWDQELDAAGAAPDPAADVRSGEHLVNSPRKMRRLMAEAGFEDVNSESIEFRHQWDLDLFMEWRIRLGPSSRRLASLDPRAREACTARVRQLLEGMSEEALIDVEEVILSTARRAP
jgi:SAM-dependent methyltransferase